MFRKFCYLAAVSGLVCVGNVQASSLQVSPVTLDITAPARTTSVTLHNGDGDASNVQIRIYKWAQVGGVEQLTPATDVVVSPPAAKIPANEAYTIRVVRMGETSKNREDSYRLVIDELPEVNVHRRSTTVNFASRYSLPVFFSDSSASADLQWKVERKGKELVVEATNKGTRHAKIVDLDVATTGAHVSFGHGLNGYVLPGSTMRFTTTAGAIQSGSHVNITATGDDYAVKQAAVVSGR
ncbi:molecular chaperone [Brucella sp. 21LCYQ03]|nr:molecular chaperone [Brucella sp. 21LCYQ03]